MPIVLKSASLNLLEPSGPVQACNGIALPLPLPIIEVHKPLIAVEDLQTPSAPTNAQLYILYVLLLIGPYVFGRNFHSQGANTNTVKTYSNSLILQ